MTSCYTTDSLEPTFAVSERLPRCLPRQETQETWVLSPGGEDLLEEEMATRSSILAWTIPWTEEPGGLQSIGLQRVRPDWAQHSTAEGNQSPKERSLSKWLWALSFGPVVKIPCFHCKGHGFQPRLGNEDLTAKTKWLNREWPKDNAWHASSHILFNFPTVSLRAIEIKMFSSLQSITAIIRVLAQVCNVLCHPLSLRADCMLPLAPSHVPITLDTAPTMFLLSL